MLGKPKTAVVSLVVIDIIKRTVLCGADKKNKMGKDLLGYRLFKKKWTPKEEKK